LGLIRYARVVPDMLRSLCEVFGSDVHNFDVGFFHLLYVHLSHVLFGRRSEPGVPLLLLHTLAFPTLHPEDLHPVHWAGKDDVLLTILLFLLFLLIPLNVLLPFSDIDLVLPPRSTFLGSLLHLVRVA